VNGADGLNHADGARYLVLRPDPLMTASREEDRDARQLELTMPDRGSVSQRMSVPCKLQEHWSITRRRPGTAMRDTPTHSAAVTLWHVMLTIRARPPGGGGRIARQLP
jgi:hypothetical protein